MSAWRNDLAACGRRATLSGAIAAWFANPGFVLACHYRLAHWAVRRGRVGRGLAVLLERRMITRFACHVAARARIGPGVRFPHPIAIVIGEGAVIGARATIYHQVTLGRRRPVVPDYPAVGDQVTLCCGVTLLGAVTVADGKCVAAGRLVMGPAEYSAGRDEQATRR